jgi:hypothetical protein
MAALRKQGWAAFIKNASDLPIYDVDIDFYYVTSHSSVGNIPGRRGGLAETIAVLPPQDGMQVPAHSSILGLVDPDQQKNHMVAVEFRDAAGNRWRRDIHGKLAELSAG